MPEINVPGNPFSRIALCLSGGGYRAASFHLGALSYLYRLQFDGQPLLHRVQALSTVSGGTITGVVYAMQTKKGKSFPEIYSFLTDKLHNVDLIRQGLAKLNRDPHWANPKKRKNLINAFAEIYDQEFTQGETFDIFENMENCHLKEVMFNATEFSTGVIFRFQNDGRFGNYHHPIKKSVGYEVKLADVIAASSCFTGGFEPIEWPNDFIHEEALELQEEAPLLVNFGLMDGGIYDNQGIDSILRAEARVDAKPYDLIIVSDVTSPYMKGFKFLENKKNQGWRRWTLLGIRRGINRLFWGINAILLIALIYSLYFLYRNYADNLLTGLLIGVSFFTFLISGFLFWLRFKTKRQFDKFSDYIEKELSDDLPIRDLKLLHFSEIPFHHWEALIVDRVKSLAVLVSDVFLKTIRRLVYGRLYDSPTHQYRRVSNLIRELTSADFYAKQSQGQREPDYFQNLPGCPSDLRGTYDQVIGPNLEKIAESAASFGTNLWFTETNKLEGRLEDLIVSGQASMCFNLLKYLVELRGTPNNGFENLPVKTRSEIDLVWIQCLSDWRRFKEDPDFLL
ncbi:MAG: patatin-like phospholipase family protein [Saprospiraceae bacterium]|nr:patatin-like phospholipase family protein [Saprospiraceae bacterium]